MAALSAVRQWLTMLRNQNCAAATDRLSNAAGTLIRSRRYSTANPEAATADADAVQHGHGTKDQHTRQPTTWLNAVPQAMPTKPSPRHGPTP